MSAEDSGRREGKGNALMVEAEKKLKSFSLFSPQAKIEAAMELYDKAAAQFKMTKQWDEAGDAYIKMAECAEKLSNEGEAVAAYTNAAKAYKNGNSKEAIKTFRIAAEMRMESNQFQQAAKLHQEIAAIEEKNLNIKGAIKAYTDAADCFQSEGSVPSENQALLKVAELCAGEEDYVRAITIYEKVAAAALESTLLKYSVKDYMFKAALCQLVLCAKDGDMKTLEDKLEKYKDQHPAFDGDRSCKLLEACMKAFEDEDVEAFTNHVFNYDKIYKLDNWTASLLLIVKKILKNGGVASDKPGEPDEPDLS
jgi:alpha-soluble NSF attachment protein